MAIPEGLSRLWSPSNRRSSLDSIDVNFVRYKAVLEGTIGTGGQLAVLKQHLEHLAGSRRDLKVTQQRAVRSINYCYV